MADFTPGPWEAGPNPHGLYSNDWVVRPAGEFPHGEWIADVGAGTTNPIRRANARLIAAAPEMYEALKAAKGALQPLAPKFARGCALGHVRDALAKAEAH
jgi:hypothetical protein